VTPSFFIGVFIGAGVVLAGLGGFFLLWPWLRALLSGAPVPLMYFLAMRLRGTPVGLVVDAYVSLRKAGRDVPLAVVEATYLAERDAIADERDLVRRVQRQLADGKVPE